jgi:predicted Zn-dependent protease with MMP-like domain
VPLRRRGSQARRQPSRRVELPRQSHESFERLVERALDGLPQEMQRLLENVAIVIEDEPEGGHDQEVLYGLYEGVPATEYGSDWVALPNKITLFRLPLEEDFADPRELEGEVRRTVVHELAHHAGIDDARLHELDLD